DKENTGNELINYSSQDYSISVSKSDVNDWTFISLMNAKQIDNLLLSRKLLFIILLTILLLAGISAAIIFANKQYKPIRNLYEKTRESNKTLPEIKGNELDTINYAIADIIESHENLSNRVLIQKPFARDQLDRKSTRLNSSHVSISYAVFCLKKKKNSNKKEKIE